ncbi:MULTISPECIES: acyl carrier protein [Streptomyces]|uniref:Acyl carrier protein n=2 Tax=Streptomyces TaxID=1883 RepID=A0AAU8KQU5_9ACTN|nr:MULTISPECIES: acyl carrier protein [Streptomyces]NUV68130.1 acyl carrier protein [Streptomyces sp. CAI-121]NUW00630.1 acyl carrier protein [Streptomyces sp. CAI 127]NUW14312.1 acyl carrier protein [Streptomyces sp. CAI-68]PJN30423.1 phosphopantetheine-binding protein [Streptomyces sp. CB02613]SCE34022.1 Acyl carrier protein [Streptomyces sp. Termitarium-T10T-6]
MWDTRFEELLRGHLPYLGATEPLDADLSLRDVGLDSMAMVELLSSIESSYDVRFADEAMSMRNFETPARLWATLESVRA